MNEFSTPISALISDIARALNRPLVSENQIRELTQHNQKKADVVLTEGVDPNKQAYNEGYFFGLSLVLASVQAAEKIQVGPLVRLGNRFADRLSLKKKIEEVTSENVHSQRASGEIDGIDGTLNALGWLW